MVGLLFSIPHSTGVNALNSALENWKEKQIPNSDLLNMAEFVLGNNYFEFFEKISFESLLADFRNNYWY